ncbi:MAG: aminopeptidase P N-terminal domain-containing protein [Candidatus Eiseniibacteriota bacterium]
MTTPETFRARRAAALERMAPSSVLLLRSNPEQTRSNDTHFPFRQDSDVHYLTGFGEPDCVVVLTNAHPEHRFVLFVRPRDPERETWDGRRAGVEGALAEYGPDAVHPIGELEEKLPAYLEGARTLYFTNGPDAAFGTTVDRLLARLRRTRPRTGKGPVAWVEQGEVTHELRLRKTSEELGLLRRASAITVEAHNAALAATRPGMSEREIEALLNYTFRVRGGSGPGYNSIVAGGVNGTILHYTENRSPLVDGELLLIDAAAEYEGYTADVTRTFPVGARYTPAQRAVYDIVLEAQHAAIAEVRPGNRFDDVHQAALEVLVGGLVRLGVLEGTVEELIAEKAYQPFYMHRTGHWLGLDVHDVGLYVDGKGESRPLEPGMVLTVEPGLYFGDVAVPYDARYRGIGIRVEDDVVVTASGHEVLTEGAIKQPDEVEAARAGKTVVTPLPVG